MATKTRREFIAGATATAALGALGQVALGEEPQHDFTPGSYVGIGEGRGGQIIVEVTLGDSRIESIRIVSQDETPIIADAPLSRIPQQVVANQSVAVDVVAHATMTSIGVIDAIKDALIGAGVDPAEVSGPCAPYHAAVPSQLAGDIAIVGGGVCGMAAAIRAAQLGVPVVLFEQSAHLGGDALLAEGWFYGSGTLMQKAAGEEDSAEAVLADIEEYRNPESKLWYDPEISRKFHENAGRTCDWIDQYVGARFHNREICHGTYGGGAGLAHRIFYLNGGVNLIEPMLRKLNQAVRDGLVTIAYETEVTHVLQSDDGSVAGVEAVMADGSTMRFPFKAVMLATGGYHHNREMVDLYLGPNVVSGGGSTSTGSGFRMCEELGMEETNMSGLALAYAGSVPSKFGMAATVSHFAEAEYPGVLWIDEHGMRSYDESLNHLQSHAAWQKAPDGIMNIVFPAAGRLAYRGIMKRAGAQDTPFTPNESWNLFDRLLEEGEYVFEADTAAELAEKLGVDDVDAFIATIDVVQACHESGEPDELGRESFPDFSGKLYGIKTFTTLHNSFGGVKRNSEFQPIREDGGFIEGLYAGGELCGIGLIDGATKMNVIGGGTGIGGFCNQGRIIIEEIIAKLTGMDTELAPYDFEGSPDDYDIDVYEEGDFVGLVPVFMK